MSAANVLRPVTVRVEVARPVEQAFAYYTEQMVDWWPLASHSVGQEEAAFCGIEGRVGGRVFERTKTGEEHLWGTIVVWDPPNRLVHSWHPSHPGVRETEVSVTFTALGDDATQVTLEHRGFEVFGDRADGVRSNYDKGWAMILGSCFGESSKEA